MISTSLEGIINCEGCYKCVSKDGVDIVQRQACSPWKETAEYIARGEDNTEELAIAVTDPTTFLLNLHRAYSLLTSTKGMSPLAYEEIIG